MKNFFDELLNSFFDDTMNLFHKSKTSKNDFYDLFNLLNILIKDISNDLFEEKNKYFNKKTNKQKPSWHWKETKFYPNYYDNFNESFYQFEDYDFFHKKQKKSQSSYTIPYDSKIASYYAILELPYGSSLEAVKTSWKNLCKKYHPDLFTNDLEKQKYGNIIVLKSTEAYKEIEKFLKQHNK